jgi:pyruvate/2-oxoglutarate dehydrogenase complex dihydrolipoamide acyltransferase (E2) component
MYELTLPKLGQAMEEGVVLEWLFNEDNRITEGETVVIFETDKTSGEITAEEDGVLLAKTVAEGETVAVGAVLGYVGGVDEELPAGEAATAVADDEESAEPTPAESVGAPKYVNSTNAIRATPTVRRVARERGVTIEEVGSAVGARRVTRAHVREYVADGATSGSDAAREDVLGSPYARKVASERGVDIRDVGHQQDTSRVRVADIEAYLEATGEDGAVVEAEVPSPPTEDGEISPDNTPTSAEDAASNPTEASPLIREERSIEGTQRVMFERMSEVASKYCTTTTVAKVDVTELLALRDRLAEVWSSEHDIEPSLTAFVTKAVAERVPEYPELNAELVGDDQLRLFEDVNIGFAVNTDAGLLVPTVYAAPSKSVRELTGEIDGLIARARDGDLSFQEMQNGTFTVTNAGSLGTYLNTPKILPPQTAILSLCAVFDEMALRDGEAVSRKKLHLCLTYDHRVVEGATAVAFVQSVGALLEQPEALLA